MCREKTIGDKDLLYRLFAFQWGFALGYFKSGSLDSMLNSA